MGDVNLTADFEPDILTRIADAIPLIDTDVQSRLLISAEAAVCIPEPNTKGFVTIDDMEGVENISMLGVTRRLWTHSSVPASPGVLASDRMPINWYNPDRKVREGDLHPELSGQEADDIHTVLEVSYDDTAGSSSWAGVMRLLSKTGNDYSREEFVELWVNDNGYREGSVFVDLGTLNEDFYPLAAPDGELDSEDTDRNGFDADEDTGLDNVFGVDADHVSGDDQNDDYSFTYGSDDYRQDQRHGAQRAPRHRGPERELVPGHVRTSTGRSTWTSPTPPTSSRTTATSRPATTGGSTGSLSTTRVSVNGMSDWAVVKSARVWFQGLRHDGDPIMIGSMDIVGNQWEVEAIRDTAGVAVPDEPAGRHELPRRLEEHERGPRL